MTRNIVLEVTCAQKIESETVHTVSIQMKVQNVDTIAVNENPTVLYNLGQGGYGTSGERIVT